MRLSELWKKYGIKPRCQHDWHVQRTYGDYRLHVGSAAEAICKHCRKWRRASLAELEKSTENTTQL